MAFFEGLLSRFGQRRIENSVSIVEPAPKEDDTKESPEAKFASELEIPGELFNTIKNEIRRRDVSLLWLIDKYGKDHASARLVVGAVHQLVENEDEEIYRDVSRGVIVFTGRASEKPAQGE